MMRLIRKFARRRPIATDQVWSGLNAKFERMLMTHIKNDKKLRLTEIGMPELLSAFIAPEKTLELSMFGLLERSASRSNPRPSKSMVPIVASIQYSRTMPNDIVSGRLCASSACSHISFKVALSKRGNG